MIAINAVDTLFVMKRVHAVIQYSCTGMGARVFKVRKKVNI
jgi:hypothetical protein